MYLVIQLLLACNPIKEIDTKISIHEMGWLSGKNTKVFIA